MRVCTYNKYACVCVHGLCTVECHSRSAKVLSILLEHKREYCSPFVIHCHCPSRRSQCGRWRSAGYTRENRVPATWKYITDTVYPIPGVVCTPRFSEHSTCMYVQICVRMRACARAAACVCLRAFTYVQRAFAFRRGILIERLNAF